MLNSTQLLSCVPPPLQVQDIIGDAHFIIALIISVCILLWCAAQFEDEQMLKDVLQQYNKHQQQQQREQEQQQQQNEQQLKHKPAKSEPPTVAAARVTEQSLTPRQHQKIRRANPILSVERQKPKRSQSAAAPKAAQLTKGRSSSHASLLSKF